MTQRIFDTDNEEDMKLLWSILPDNVVSVELEEVRTINRRTLLVYNDKTFCACPLKIDFKGKEKITRPVDYESMIGCVGWFWDNYEEEKSLGILTEYRSEIEFHFVKGNNDNVYSHFRPAKKSELKFWGE